MVANANENAAFSVTVLGTPFPVHQWRKDGTNISAATNTTHGITNVQGSHAGGYTVVCTNTSGAVTSAIASLIVHADSAARLTLYGTSSNEIFFHIFGLTNRAYRIEMATNLTAPINWSIIHTNMVSFWYTNAGISTNPMRFYRAITNGP